MHRKHPWHRLVSLVAAVSMTVSLDVATAQNDPDEVLATSGHTLDFAYADDGTEVAAFVVPGATQDEIVVQSRTTQGGSWTQLHRGKLGLLNRIVDLSVALADDYPTSAGDDKVFIGVHGVWRSGGGDLGFTGLLSGSYRNAWPSAKCAEILPEGGASYARPWPGMKLSCAIVPLIGSRSTDYAVAVAFKFPLFTSDSIQLVYSRDYGQTVQRARIVAGPLGECIDADGRFGWPCVIGDPTNREVVVSFDQEDLGQIVLANADAVAHVDQSARLAINFATPDSNGGREHRGTLGRFDGDINLVCLFGDANSNQAYRITWFYGSTLAGFREVFDFNGISMFQGDRAVTPPDIDIRGSDARIAALCITDTGGKTPGVGVIAWESSRLGEERLRVQVSDGALSFADPTRAKVAIAPRGSPYRAYSYGFCEYGSRAGKVCIDP